jgi:PPOX class probable F420-dependent enzyme
MPEQDTPERFLSEPHIAVLSTVDREGRPHVLPIWYLYEDGEIIMLAGARSQKRRNIERNPEVALTVDRRSVPYYAVMARGTAAIGPPPDDDLRLRIAVRYLGEELGRQYTARGSAQGTITIRMRPRRLIEYRGQAGRSRAE